MGRAWDTPPTSWSFDEYLRGIPTKARKLACTDGGVNTREWFDATQRVVARMRDITASFHWTSPSPLRYASCASNASVDACSTIKVHRLFSEVPQFGRLRPLSQQLVWRKLKLVPDEKSHNMAWGQNENQAKKMSYFRRFCVKKLRHSENHFGRKKGIPLLYYASVLGTQVS